MKVKITDIKIKNRIREDIGDLSTLEQSINSFGLFNPIIINQNYELLAGARRLTACKNLGWNQIDVKIIETKDELTKLEIESHENFMRKDFTEIEVEKVINKKRKLLLKKGFFMSILNMFKKLFKAIYEIISKPFSKNSTIQSF